LVEDEWDRELESEEPLDLLFITYNADDIAIEKMTATVDEQGFQAEIKKK